MKYNYMEEQINLIGDRIGQPKAINEKEKLNQPQKMDAGDKTTTGKQARSNEY